MSASTKLSTSVKAICFLAQTHPVPQNSRQISDAICVNASKLRQLLSMLKKSDIVESTKGTSGGFILKIDPKKLDLQRIYCAIEDRKAFHLDVNKDGQKKWSSKDFNDYFLNLFADIQIDIENKMRKISVENINVRALIVYSKEDNDVKWSHAEYLTSNLKDFDLLVTHGGHFMWVGEDMERIKLKRIEFLNSIDYE